MILNFKKVDFDYVKQTIDGLIMYSVCLCNIVNDEIKNINENKLKLFLQSLAKNDLENSEKMLTDFCSKARELKDNKYLINFVHSLKKMYFLNYTNEYEDFEFIVKSTYFIFNEKDNKIKKTYLYRDKTTTKGEEKDIVYYNDLTFIRDTKLILDKTKEIANECIEESLAKYYNIAKATKSFAEKFAKSKENEKK